MPLNLPLILSKDRTLEGPKIEQHKFEKVLAFSWHKSWQNLGKISRDLIDRAGRQDARLGKPAEPPTTEIETAQPASTL